MPVTILRMMIVKKISIAIILSALAAAASAGYAYVLQDNAAPQKQIQIQNTEKKITLGERLEYSVEWLGIPSASAVLSVEGMVDIDGHSCYHIVARGAPNRFFAKFHNKEYIVHTYIDKDTFCSRRFEKISRTKTKAKREAFDFKEGSQDILSSFYFFRLMDVRPEAEYTVKAYYARRNWLLNIKTQRPFFKEIRKKGVLAVFEARIKSDLNRYILGQPDVLVYFTADNRRIPIEFKFRSKIGVIRGVLRSIPANSASPKQKK